LPSEGYLTENETNGGGKEIEEKISDFLMKIENEVYILECQSYDDGSMAIRIAEYAFITARQSCKVGHRVCRHTNAKFCGDICQEDKQDT
jgi:hypothetical protein